MPQLHLFVINRYVLFLLWASERKAPFWPCLGWPSAAVRKRERGNFAPSPPWPPSPASLAGKAGQVQEGGQRPAQDSAGSEPGCFQRGAWSWHCSAYWAGERDFLGSVCCKTERHREALTWNWDGGKDHLCKDPLDWEEICVQNSFFFFFLIPKQT